MSSHSNIDRDISRLGAVVVTDRAGVIRAMNADAARLLNVARVGQTRELSTFFGKGHLGVLAASREMWGAHHGAVLQPIGRGAIPVTVAVTQDDDGLQWVIHCVHGSH